MASERWLPRLDQNAKNQPPLRKELFLLNYRSQMPTPRKSDDDIIDLTKQLIRIPSTATNPTALRAAVELLRSQVAVCPEVTIEPFDQGGKPSFLAYRGGVRPDKFDIILNAHVDVVPGPAKMFNPVVKDDLLFGRGALDMKGTAATLTTVFCELNSSLPYSLGLQIVSDEEVGGHNGAKAQIDAGVRSDFVLIGEYSNDRGTIYNAARGLCWIELRFKGKAAHGGHLWHGSNAVMKAGNFARELLRAYPTPDKETWTTTASVASIQTSNKVYNKVPDSAVLKIDFRFTKEDPVFLSRDTLSAFLVGIDPDVEIASIATFEPAVNVARLNPYVQGLSRAMTNVLGTKPSYLGRPAGSDGRHFAQGGTGVIEYGLYGAHSHSDQEFVELSSFAEYRRVIEAFLRAPTPARRDIPQATSGAAQAS